VLGKKEAARQKYRDYTVCYNAGSYAERPNADYVYPATLDELRALPEKVTSINWVLTPDMKQIIGHEGVLDYLANLENLEGSES